jgi:hypothetical protein
MPIAITIVNAGRRTGFAGGCVLAGAAGSPVPTLLALSPWMVLGSRCSRWRPRWCTSIGHRDTREVVPQASDTLHGLRQRSCRHAQVLARAQYALRG